MDIKFKNGSIIKSIKNNSNSKRSKGYFYLIENDEEKNIMNCIDRIKVDKYEVVIETGKDKFNFYVLRDGEQWIDNLTMVDGSNLIMCMAYEIQRLRNKLEKER